MKDSSVPVARGRGAREAGIRAGRAAPEAALYRDVAQKLHKMVDAGELSIALRDGRMVLQLPEITLQPNIYELVRIPGT